MNIIISGIGGRMGSEVLALCQRGYRDAAAVCGIDKVNYDAECPVKIYKSFDEVDAAADCVIDFSHHSVCRELLDFCVSHRLPVVVATTAHTDEEKALIYEASKSIPVFFSANMSLGVALLCELAAITARTMPEADIEIIEKHHNRKLDAPSGTALMIASAIHRVRKGAKNKLGRAGNAKREVGEIGIHAVRLGNIVGEHEVIVGTDTQTVTLKHEAHTRALFAEGAVVAADFLKDKPAGLYDMNSMIKGE